MDSKGFVRILGLRKLHSQAGVASQVLKQALGFVRFLGLFGFYFVRVLAHVRVLFGTLVCSGCSGFSVENLCKRVWESLWGKGGKISGKVLRGQVLVEKVKENRVLHVVVEKFYYEFCTWIFLCKRPVLHSFHNPYYYNYYLLYRGKEI